MNLKHLEHLGSPDIHVGGLRLWVRGRQFPDAIDYWDANWLMIAAIYASEAASVFAEGPLIHAPELAKFLDELEALTQSLAGFASLNTMEPNLKIRLSGNGRGRIDFAVSLTPNHLTESHDFRAELDQTHLSPLILSCRKLVADFPITGQGSGNG